MRPSLAGPRLKLHRAGEHLDYLNGLIDPFIGLERDRISVEFDSETSCKVFRLDPRPTPPEWGPIIGDVLYNCRSALDQMANQLAGARKNDRITAFPICRSPDDFISAGKPLIRRVPAKAQTFIEECQPYNRSSHRPEYDAMWLHNALCNEDKHRQLHVTVTSFEGGASWSPFEVARANFGPVVSGTPFLALRVPGSEVDVPFNFSLEIALADQRRWAMPVKVNSFLVEVIDKIEVLFAQSIERGLISP